MICERFDIWLCVEVSSPCAFSTEFIMGSVPGNCLTCNRPPNFHKTNKTSKFVTNSSSTYIIWIRGTSLLCGFVGASFHAPHNCRMAYLRQCFQVDMTWIPSKSLHLEGRRIIFSCGVTWGHGWRWSLTIRWPVCSFACFFFHKKNSMKQDNC